MNKQLEDKEAKAKYEALKAEIAINMTASNSWRNGVMKVAGVEGEAAPNTEQKYDIPMHEVKPLANQAPNVNGKMGPQALKYENTTATASTVQVHNRNATTPPQTYNASTEFANK